MAQFLTDTAFAGNIESGGNIFPTSNGGGTLGLGNKQFSGLNLSSSSSVTWANGDASILEGEVGGYSLSFNVYNGVAALERVLLLEKSKVATFAGNVSVNNKIELYSDGTLNWGAAHDSGRLTFDTGIAVVAGLSGKSLVLRSNGSGSSNTALTLDTSQNATFAGDVDLPDDKRLRFGNQDLQIFHSSVGTGSFIQESGPGSLEIYSDTGVNIKSGALGENFAKFTKDGPIELYYDNSKKFETTSAGITVTGNIVVSSTVDGRDVASDGSKLDGISANARTGTVTQVSVGTGLDVSSATSVPVIGLDLSELNDIDGDDPQITDFVVVSSEGESARCSLADTKVALGVNKNQFVLNSNFSDDVSTTSSTYFPFNSLTDGTSSQYYRHWAAPCTGRVKRIVMQHTSGSMSSGFTTTLQVYKNGSTFTTSGSLTVTTTSDGGYIEYNPTGSGVAFVKGDRIRIRFAKSATGKYWRGVAASVIIELDQV